MSMDAMLEGMKLRQAHEDGMWEMFQLITSAYFGKQYYFEQDNGVVYSKMTHKYLKDREEAYNEYIKSITDY